MHEIHKKQFWAPYFVKNNDTLLPYYMRSVVFITPTVYSVTKQKNKQLYMIGLVKKPNHIEKRRIIYHVLTYRSKLCTVSV